MKIIDLFCGTKSISHVFQDRGHDVFTVDNNPKFNPDICCDMLYINKKSFPKEWRNPDVIWASPPCETFSLSGNSYYLGYPTTSKAYIGLALAYKCLELIREMKPKIWFIENPRAGLRAAWFMRPLQRDTVTYCQYGMNNMKPTDIFNNCDSFNPKPPCKNNDSCHVSAPRGSGKGTQGEKSTELRGIIPRNLCEEVCVACEKEIKLSALLSRSPEAGG